jgi:DNA-directed RNA polymerase specialized sigma24 family protein
MMLQTSPAERRERKRKLQTMTPALYDELLANISRIMNPGFCDPGDALNEAIIVAMKKYRGEGSLKSFITRAAWLYALEQFKKYTKRQIAFSNLETEQDFGDYLETIIAYTEDPRYVEAVDELFIQRIEQILYIRRGYPINTPPETVRNAKKILKLYRENANLGKGV